MQAVMQPTPEPISLTVLMNLSRDAVDDARRRHILHEPFMELLEQCCRLHFLSANLLASTIYIQELAKLGQEAPHIKETQEQLLADIKSVRLWFVKHLQTMQEMGDGTASLN